ncbi:50S ribosomal protein L20 [Oenococcus oeni]|nr:50S ribosomal protein L20P [Oenococcus oeni AWRIB418]KDP19561.1 50S ribosomal protein L20 [Oenococcus oeni]KGH65345.1 50S ribosomal protein L20 [Oenococcus oeni IOEB_C23]KGH73262.1 50S ribosomal protein L20 [Oenococcus oeni IOEB_0502]KGH79121.1 50S ribosomal protein L20 [Oenococcus oeni IOEB_9304]KGH87213.1 50S ribosomal protein L20 [Oenococcus oeni IOEB_C28]KGH89254.1 50S ribosomal protein L20 [Oenococcus oeni S12]
MRVKGTNVTRIRRKKMIKLAKGYRGQRHINFKVAKQQVWKSYLYAYRDRKNVKRDYRKLWIARINAASRMNGISYSQLMHGLKVAGIDLNRKMLAELAVSDFATFSKLAETAKKQVSAPTRKAATLDTDIKIERIEKGAAKPVVLEPGKSTKTQEVAVAEKPTAASTVAEIKAYLDSESIKYPSSAKKADLLALVK